MNDAHYILVDYIQKWGNAASIALFNPVFKQFSIPSIQGIIGYRDENNCAIVFGDPLCNPEDAPTLIDAFQQFCAQSKKKIVYIMISQNLVTTINAQNSCSVIEFGNEIIVNPYNDPKRKSGMYGGVLRNKCHQAQKNQMVVKEYRGNDPELETTLTNIGMAWSAARKGPQIHFVHIELLFSDRSNKRWFYAQQDGIVHGVVMLNRIDAHHGWVQNLLMVHPDAPKYTSEFMLLSILDTLRTEGCSFYSAGPLPAPKLGKIEGLNKIKEWMVRASYAISKKIFKLTDRQKFWKKFEPRTEPSFIVFSSPRIGLNEILGIMKAFNAKL